MYEWIAARVAGGVVLDMACGEGYGSEVLARAAASVVGVDGNPEAHEHAKLRYTAPNLTFEWGAVETFGEPDTLRRGRVPPDDRARDRPAGGARPLQGILKPGGVAYVSTPNVLKLAPAGQAKSDNPWHLREYRASVSSHELCRGTFADVEMLGLFHARKLRVHEAALALGWDRVHKRHRTSRTRSTAASRRRSQPATSRCGATGSTARSTSSPSAAPEPKRRMDRGRLGSLGATTK